MATKDELIDGLELLVREARRLSTALTEAQWQNVVDLDGWKNKEVLAHVAGVATLVVPMTGGIANAPAGSDAIGGLDIDQINAGLVGARAGKSAPELADEAESAYQGVISFVKDAPADLLDRKVNAGGYKDTAMSEILNRMVVLHGLAHIYSVYSSVFNTRD